MIEGRPVPPDRTPCIIPGCGRTFKLALGEGVETCCGKHWRMAPKPMRDRYTELVRLYRRRPSDALRDMLHRQWQRITAAAIDAAAGNINPVELAAFVEAL